MFVIFPASVGWSAYVFTGHIWLSVVYFLIWPSLLAPITIIMFKARRGMPKPPPGGWPDEKARLDVIAKWQEERQKRTDAEQEQRYKETESIVLGLFHKRGWLFYVRWIAGIILSVWGSAITIVALWYIITPGPNDSLGTSILVIIVLGILPLTGGIALCAFAGKRWLIGIILSLFGIAMVVLAVGDMSSSPSDLPLAANIAIMIFVGILPLAGGIALCVHDIKKRRKLKAK
jgi:hypothetical protein